jgi:hypothetical protein
MAILIPVSESLSRLALIERLVYLAIWNNGQKNNLYAKSIKQNKKKKTGYVVELFQVLSVAGSLVVGPQST